MHDPVKYHQDFVADVINKKLLEGKYGTIYIPELLAKVSEFSKRDDKIKVLRMNQSPALLVIFRLALDDDIEFNFTRKDLDALEVNPMDIADYSLAPTTLLKEGRKFAMYTDWRENRLSKERSLKLVKELFSALHPNDVEIFKQMVDGKFKARGVTKKLILEAFPNLIPKKNPLPFEGGNEGTGLNNEEKGDD